LDKIKQPANHGFDCRVVIRLFKSRHAFWLWDARQIDVFKNSQRFAPLFAGVCEFISVILTAQTLSWHVQCLSVGMAIFVKNKSSQTFDDSHFFQRLTLIDICCGPPIQA
jgi:hypothetical protein